MSVTITGCNLISDTTAQGDNGISGTAIYQVSFTGSWNSSAVRNATYSGKPNYRSTHPDEPLAYASNVEAKLDENSSPYGDTTAPAVCVYTVTWAQKSISFDPNPLNRPAEIEWGGTELTETPTKDADGKPLVNSAGELYDGLPERPLRKAAECTITRNEASNPATVVTTMSNTTNSAAIWGVAIGNATLGTIRARKMQEQVNGSTVTYWQVTYPIRFRADGWKLKPIDSGRSVRIDTDDDGTDDTTITYTDDTGQKPDNPILLDGSGHKLDDGADPVVFPTDGYKILDEANWATLSLPNPFA